MQRKVRVSAFEPPTEFLDIGHHDCGVEGRIPRRSTTFPVDPMDVGRKAPGLVPGHPRTKVDAGTTVEN